MLALLSACNDSLPTGPDRLIEPTAAPRAVRYPSLSDFSALESPEFLSSTLSVQDYGVNPTETIMGYYARPTVLTLKLTGSAQSSGITPVGAVGVKGIGEGCGSSNPWMDWDNNRFAACAYGPEITIAVRGVLRLHLSYFGNGLAPSNSAPCYGGAFSGDQTSTVPCTQWTGSFTGTAQRLPVELSIMPVDTMVNPGGAATFQLKTSPEKLGGFWDGPPPREHIASWFVPDAAEEGGVEADTVIKCALLDNARGCRVAPQGSGTVHVIQLLNGGLKEQAAHVRVKSPRIRMTLSADSVTAGDTVYVTTEILDADRDTLLEYRWAASGPGPILASRLSPLSPARAAVALVPTGATRSVSGGDGVPCLQQPAAKRCFVVPLESGVLTVNGMGDGKALSASKPIKVTAPLLKLECKSPTSGLATSITITRTDVVTCTATRDGEKAKVKSWSFTSTDPILPGWSYPRADGDPTSPEWQGPVVISGTVHVESVNGSADATITVSARDWSGEHAPATIVPHHDAIQGSSAQHPAARRERTGGRQRAAGRIRDRGAGPEHRARVLQEPAI